MKKKLISFILTASMLLSCASVFAEGTEYTEETETAALAEAVEVYGEQAAALAQIESEREEAEREREAREKEREERRLAAKLPQASSSAPPKKPAVPQLGGNLAGSSAGRALEWHSRGQRFDPAYLHQVENRLVFEDISKIRRFFVKRRKGALL